MPITRGSTPATALPTNAPSGSAPSSFAFSSLATTSAAAPSLIPLELPAVTVPSLRNAGFSARKLVGVGVGPRMLVARQLADRHELVGEAPLRVGRRPALLRLERERVLVLARDLPALGDVLARLPIDSSGNISSMRGLGNRQPSVVSQIVWLPRGNARSGFAITSGARLIDSTPPATKRSPSPAATAWHAPTTADSPDAQSRLTVTPATDSGSPARSAAMRATFRLSSPAWLAQPSQTSSISPAATPDALDGRSDRRRRKIVRPHPCERAAVAADRSANGGEDHRPGHPAQAN